MLVADLRGLQEIAMQTCTPKKRFAGVLIAFATLTTTNAPAQVTSKDQSRSPVVVALSRSARESAQPPHAASQQVESPNPVAASRQRPRTINSRPITQDSALSFLPVVSYYSGGYDAFSIAVADVNGDGKPDLLVANYCGSSITCFAHSVVGVLLGNGDGTFQPAVTYNSGGPRTVSLVVADVNGDGVPDLVVANQCFSQRNCASGGVGVLLGNGNGTFQVALTYSTGLRPASSVVVGDVNGDGKPDLVVTTSNPGSVGVLLGNGDGTFQPVVTYAASGPEAAAIADINGDGNPDVLVADTSGAGVLLGNGDGTFQPEVMYSSGGLTPTSIVSADLNGDGKQDLVVMNFDSGNVGVLLGNGDGTFQTAVTYGGADGSGTPSVAVADVNGDGKLDLLVVNFCVDKNCDGGIGVFLGNGDGTFQPESVFVSGGYYAWALAVADVNGDGKPDVVAANLQLSRAQPLKGFVGVLLNNTSFGKSTTSTSLTSSLNPSTYGQKVTWTSTVTSSGSTIPKGKVNFTWSGHTIGSATLSSAGVATLTRSNLNADPYPLTAVYTGDANNLRSTSAVVNQAVLETTSTATLTSSPNPSAHGQAVTFTAKISSPTVIPTGPVTFTVGKTVLGTAQLSGGKAKLVISSLPVGSTKVTATYYGDSNIAKSSASVAQTVH
jgi:hypothetical protein